MKTAEQLDTERAELLAERARELLLWIRDNEPAGAAGVKGRPRTDFAVYAGIYRRLDPEVLRFGGKIIQFWDRPEEVKRLQSLRLGASHVLLSLYGESVNGMYGNEMYFLDNKSLEEKGAVLVNAPALDSEPADRPNLGFFRIQSFAGLRNKADMVYDDVAEATRVHIDPRVRFIFDYDAPREEYRKHVKQIIPAPNMRLEEFRQYLYWYATYENATTIGTGGDYYGKWRDASPLKAAQRTYVPTKLSDQYLKESFYEYVLKKGENYAFLRVPGAQLLYHLQHRTRRGKQQSELYPKLILRFQRPVTVDQKDSETPIPLVVFHALDGASQHPPILGTRGELDLRGVPSGRVAYDFKAAVRQFFAPDDYDASSDEQWFTTFVDMLFPDAVYAVRGGRLGATLSTLSMDDLVAQADVSEGPIKEQIERMKQLAAATPEIRFVLKGAYYGETHANRRQLIGVIDEQVYEWYPETSLVTRMGLADWYEQNYYGKVINDVYESTKGIVPFIMLVTFGGVAVAGGAVIGAGAAISALGRQAFKTLVSDQVAKKVTKETLRKFRAQAIALIADGILSLLPPTRDLRFELFRGFVHGFGAGAIDHYLSQVDDRFAKQAKRLYNKALSKATKGVSRAYQVYMKLSAAYHKLGAVFKAIRAVWTEARARAAADGLMFLINNAGLGLLVLLFTVVYFDYIYRSGKADKKARDEWAKAQRDLLQLMIKETGSDIAEYATVLWKGTQPGADTIAIRAQNDRLAQRMAIAVAKAPQEAPNVLAIFKHILEELGVENVQELLDLGLFEIMSRGLEAMLADHPGFAPKHANVLGEALGEVIGTIFLERTMLPKKWRESKITGNRDLDKAIRKTLADGTSKALWNLAKAPISELKKSLPAMAKGLVTPPSDTPSLFESAKREETWYRDQLRDLLESERDLSATLATLAQDQTLPAKIAMVKARAATESPPDIEALLAGEDPLWPRDAMTFILATWARVGMEQLLRTFEALEDAKPYADQFRLASILEIAGLQVSLDDTTVQELRVNFERRGS